MSNSSKIPSFWSLVRKKGRNTFTSRIKLLVPAILLQRKYLMFMFVHLTKRTKKCVHVRSFILHDSKEHITSLVKSNEEIVIENQNKEEATTSNFNNLRISELKGFVKEKNHEFFNHLNDSKKAMDNMATIPLLTCEIYEIDNKENEDTTRVGPFKVRTTQAPTVDDCKLLELCFGKVVTDDQIVVGVADSNVFEVTKKGFCKSLRPKGWFLDSLVSCVADMLCVRECNTGDIQRWFFPVQMQMQNYRLCPRKRNRATHYITKEQLQSVKQIFFPCYRTNHFYLIVFNNIEHKVEIWDSMKRGIQKYKNIIKDKSHFLDDNIGDAMFSFKQYTPILIDVPQQANTFDCGVFVCRSMEFPDDVMKFHTNEWISEEERCTMAVRILKANENAYSQFFVEKPANV